jgi:hypothetical protein
MPMAMFIENAQFIQNRLSVLLEMREFRFFFARIGRLVELAAILTFGMKSGNAQVRTWQFHPGKSTAADSTKVSLGPSSAAFDFAQHFLQDQPFPDITGLTFARL